MLTVTEPVELVVSSAVQHSARARTPMGLAVLSRDQLTKLTVG